MTDLAPMKRALISVSDKTGLIDLGKALTARNIALVSTGGTASALREAGLRVQDVSDLTSYPEMMDGRVKTLHPVVHGGLLALRDNEAHQGAMQAHGIEAIDLLVVNLYPFEATVALGAGFDLAIENIDIGGPAMIRAAAKNHRFVTVVTDPEDYIPLLSELDAQDGRTRLAFRKTLAQRAYARTAAYDAAVSTWMAGAINAQAPRRRAFAGTLAQKLRYGENPHQAAAFYRDGTDRPGVATAKQHQGKELSYNNINDTDAAFELVSEFPPAEGPACAIIKHANPCGVAVGATALEAYDKAFATDPTSAFGGIIAFNVPLDAETARAIIDRQFVEVIIAPGVSADAAEIVSAKQNVRLLDVGEHWPGQRQHAHDVKRVTGGLLVQDRDLGMVGRDELTVVTERVPTEQEMRDLAFAWKVAKYVKSNAIVYAKGGQTIGVGAGQMSRVYSAKIAGIKAADEGLSVPGSVMASDAFFPFRDGIDAAAAAGIAAVIQPGGSMRDQEVIDAANEAGIAMVFTGMRHFRH